jgi:hypothetical protein
MSEPASKAFVLLGTASVQRYIFRSNKLKENVGASYLVKHALEDGLLEQMHEIDASEWFSILGDAPAAARYTRHDAKGKAIYLAGGNAVLLFEGAAAAEDARNAVYRWSRWLLKEKAPGLRVSAAVVNVPASGSPPLQAAYGEALKELEADENAPPFGSPLLSLPIVRTCSSTGLPAIIQDTTSNDYLSAEANAKRQSVGSEQNPDSALGRAYKDFAAILTRADGISWRFPTELEDLGGKEGERHIAVVHIDGNDVGLKLQDVWKRDYGSDDEFVKAMRSFSSSLKKAAHAAFVDTLKELRDKLPELTEELNLADNKFPVRPIVYGGDDLTFVCDGRLGLPLAELYLKKFAEKKVEVPGGDFTPTACAGIAIVATKFPFARAYELSAELCASAKKKRIDKGKGSGSWLDFQILLGGAEASLQVLREKRFKVGMKSLLRRPWRVDEGGPPQWGDVVAALNVVRRWPRSEVKHFKEALTHGKTATDAWLQFSKSRGRIPPVIDGSASAQECGWDGESTPYYDCLETCEYYIPIQPAGTHGQTGTPVAQTYGQSQEAK